MIGDTETPDGDPTEDLGPLDAMIRLNPPDTMAETTAWIERYYGTVVIRHSWPDETGTTRETRYPTVAAAIHAMATQTAVLTRRGYRVIAE